MLLSCTATHDQINLNMYEYRDTRNLVKFTVTAAKRVEEEGMRAISNFQENRSEYQKSNFYLYVYTIEGENLFHAGMKEFEGRNLSEITDLRGKKVITHVVEALDNRENPHAWIHYSWWEPGKFYPVPKSSCNFKVTTPEGQRVFVGAGMNYPHEEKEFIRISVDTAVNLINNIGSDAYEKIASPTSQYIYRDVRVFVFDSQGKALVSPVINNSPTEIHFLESTDEAGHQPFKRALEELETAATTWQVFLAKSRDKRQLVKKILYLRKTNHNGSPIYIGAVTDLPEPPWTS